MSNKNSICYLYKSLITKNFLILDSKKEDSFLKFLKQGTKKELEKEKQDLIMKENELLKW